MKPITRLAGVLLIAMLAACSSDGNESDGTTAATTADVSTDTVAVDAFDATCELLGDRPDNGAEEVVEEVLAELTAISGDEQIAANTLRLATADRCEEWSADVLAVVGAG